MSAAWHRHIRQRRAGQSPRRPVADVLIGAFACRFRGLLTRNPRDFAAAFPDLRLVAP
jgi:predicted nucleic acid-binding protein